MLKTILLSIMLQGQVVILTSNLFQMENLRLSIRVTIRIQVIFSNNNNRDLKANSLFKAWDSKWYSHNQKIMGTDLAAVMKDLMGLKEATIITWYTRNLTKTQVINISPYKIVQVYQMLLILETLNYQELFLKGLQPQISQMGDYFSFNLNP